MVVLRNLIVDNNLVECDYFPEGNELKGHIVYDFVKDELISKETVYEYDDSIEMYFNYAFKRLKRVIISGEFKESIIRYEYYAYWY